MSKYAMTKTMRPSADKTRAKILQAAKMVFLKKGFDAAQIKDIAQAAKVNTNLIFHHFTNKLVLWHKVKETILAEHIEGYQYDLTSARRFIASLLDYRFELYGTRPDLVRLLQWQEVTEKEALLIGEDVNSPTHWLTVLNDFQAKGEISPGLDTEQILLFIIFSTHAPFWQEVYPFNQEKCQQYKEMIFSMCCHQFLALSKNDE